MRRGFVVGRLVVGRVFLTSLLVLMLGSLAWAQSPAVQNGQGWLTGNQGIDGHWPGVEVSDYHATSEALKTLSLLSPANPALTAGRSWMEMQDASPTDFLARRVVLDAGAGVDGSARVNELLGLRAPSGGWGGENSSLENVLDTALALQALKAANVSDITIVNPALAYLTTTQNTDGGWGVYKGDDSNVFMTAVVSSALQQFPQMTTIATAVSKATAYLLAHQNPDGGFGSSPSTVYETAFAFIALVSNGQTQGLPLQNAVNYLTATQAANGSWNDDPYSTALALKALYLSENRPSPPPPPPAGGTITGTAVDATTNQRLVGVAVVLGSDPLINTTTDASGNFTLRDVPPGSQQVNLSLTGYQSATALAAVVVDTTVSLGNVGLVSSYSTGTIAGTITDPAGKPLAGVAVTVTGAWSGTATTGAAGGFTFTYVTPGEVTIAAAKAGYQSVSVDGTIYARTTLTFSPRLSTTPPQATTGTLVGRVVDSTWGVPIDHLPGEKGVTVTVSGGITAEADPDNRGIFEIKGLAPGTYQVVVGMNGFATQAFSVVIVSGVTTDLGTISLKMTLSKMTLTGKVSDAVSGAPIPGAAVSVAGTLLTGRTDASGTYAIADIDHPADITVRISANGYTAKAFQVRTAVWTQTMNIALTPRANPEEVTGAEVDVTVQTDQPAYVKSDPVGLTVNLWNKVGQDYSTTLHVKMIDPAGATVSDTTQELYLAADANIIQNLNLTLPLSSPGGSYKAVAEALTANGLLLGSGSKTFSVTASKIMVTPTLPSVLCSGDNALSFNLANAGTIAVSNGLFDVTLTDPEGEVVFKGSQPFTLDLGENTTLSFTAPIPTLKFGTYKLAYTQSDATIVGATTELNLPNTLTVKALFDDNSRRIRATAGLTVTLINTGRFNLDLAGAGLPVTASVPDAGYEETKLLLPAPTVGNAAGSSLLYQFALPETLTAGLHPTTITVTLPSGSTLVQTAQLAILESSLAPSPLEKTATAADMIHPVIVNSGGVDTTVQYSLRLLDAKAALIAESTGTQTALAGEPLTLALPIPGGAVEGSYQVMASFLDQKTGKEQVASTPVTITGVKGSLQVQTDKEDYLATETITALSSIVNGGTALQNGNLHLQVVTTAGTRTQKTWTSQEDFQASSRSGVDTYGVNDWIIPVDDFERTTLDNTKWYKWGNVAIQSGKLFVDSSSVGSGVSSTYDLEGDFDIEVDFSENKSFDTGVGMSISGPTFYFVLNNTVGNGYGCAYVIREVSDVWVALGRPTYSQTGRFRITRTASTVVGYGWVANAWREIYRATDSRIIEPVHVQLDIYRGAPYLGANSTKYDNFRVNSGRVKPANQTVGSVRLLPLHDNFDDGQVNWDRWSKWGTYYVGETNGAVRLTGDASASQGLQLRSTLGGDFSAVSEYKNYASTPTKTHQGRYAMYAFVGSSGVYMNRISSHSYRGAQGELLAGLSWINDSNYQMSSDTPYAADNGRFRLRKQGDTGFADYWDGTKWVAIHSRSGMPSVPGTIVHYVLTQEAIPTVRVDLDRFLVDNRTYSENGKITFRYDTTTNGTRWGNLTFSKSQPAGTSLKFRTRTADTDAGLANALWSDYITGSGSVVTSPAARWIEIEATLNTADANVSPLLHDLTVSYDTHPGQILWQTDVPANLAVGALSDLSNTIGTLGVTGKLLLQGELTSSTGQTVSFSEYPFYVEQGNLAVLLATDKNLYRPGEIVTVSGEVKNRSSVAATGLALRVADPGAGDAPLYTDSFDLPAQSSHPFTFTITAGADGIHALQGVVSQNGTVLSDVTEQYEVASPALIATLVAPESVGNTPFAITVTLNNAGKVEAVTSVQLLEDNGTVIGVETVTIPAGETRLVQHPYQITSDTQITAVISGDLNQTLGHKIVYVALPADSTVSAKIVSDKIGYDPNEAVALTATVTAGSARENLSALVTVTNAQGQALFSATKAIPTLIQGQTLKFSNDWNVGTNPVGTYLVTLQVFDASGTVTARATCNLVINSATHPVALLKGMIALDRQNILTGEPVTVTYSVTNVGNVDLTEVALAVQTVTQDGQAVFQTIAEQATLAMGTTYSKSGAIDTQDLSARDYLVVLRANIAGTEETLAGTYFRVEGAPTAPALVSPANGSDVATLTPELVLSNAADPNDDRLTYDFEIYSDSGLTTFVAGGTAGETVDITQWLVTVPLEENQTYTWRARAYDGWLYGPWLTAASFRVNAVDDPPSAPRVSSPADGTSVAVFTPALTITNASDPDSPTLTYNFDLASDPDLVQIVASAREVESGPAMTSWTVPLALEENGWYFWRTQGEDQSGEGPWSQTAAFLVNTANDPPTAPAIAAPANSSVVAALSTDVTVSNGTDPDSPLLSYYFEADTAPTFDSANLIRPEAVVEGQQTTSWELSGLTDNTWYHVRVKASDGMAESPWSPVVAFFANTANDPPTAPVLNNPSSGAGVTVFSPTLSVRNSTDLDGDALSYEFEVCSDAAMTNRIAHADSIPETPQATAWEIPLALTENQTYFWRARVSDGALQSDWMPTASFLVNTANDAPGAPQLLAPADQATVTTLNPALAVVNAIDPDSDTLSYDFEVYSGGVLVAAIGGIPEGSEGVTSLTFSPDLADNSAYTWRARAFDGERYGQWIDMATFSTRVPKAFIQADVRFEPQTLNRRSQGQWVNVTITLPPGYRAADVDLTSVRLEGTIQAEPSPVTIQPGPAGDQFIVKFDRSEVVALLPKGEQVSVHVTGTVNAVPFEGVDVIRVIDK